MNFANGAQSPLATSINAGSPSLTVLSALSFPATPFRVVVDQEIMICTALLGNTLTVTRGTEGTAAASHAAGAIVTQSVTAADFTAFASGGGGGDRWFTLTNSPVAITSSAAMAAYDTLYVVTAMTAIAPTLPAPATSKWVGIRVDGSSTNLATITATGGATINGSATLVMWAGETAELVSDGANWYKIGGVMLPMSCSLYLFNSGGPEIQAQLCLDSHIVPIALNATLIDNTGLMANLGSNEVVLQRNGLYVIDCGPRWYYLTAAASRGLAVIYQNGDLTGGTYPNLAIAESYVGSGSAGSVPGHAEATLPAGTTLAMWMFQNTGSSQYALGGNNPGIATKFSVLEVPQWQT